MEIKDLKPVTITNTEYSTVMQYYDVLINFIGYDEELFKRIDKRFFISPASSRFHNSVSHGLLYHSVNVALLSFKNMRFLRTSLVSSYLNNLDEDEYSQYLKDTVFVGLFHDYCKHNIYKEEESLTEKQEYMVNKLCDENGIERRRYNFLGKTSGSKFIDAVINKRFHELESLKPLYEYDNQLDLGHSEKSIVELMRLGFKLTDHQLFAIRFHMMGMDVEWNIQQKRNQMMKLGDEIPMLRIVYLSDFMSGTLFE